MFPYPRGQGHTIEDDETYARMLQYQEAAALPPARQRPTDGAMSVRSDASSDQEARDLQLARDLVRQDMEALSLRGGGGRTPAPRTPDQYSNSSESDYQDAQNHRSHGSTIDGGKINGTIYAGIQRDNHMNGTTALRDWGLESGTLARVGKAHPDRIEGCPDFRSDDERSRESSDLEMAWQLQQSEFRKTMVDSDSISGIGSTSESSVAVRSDDDRKPPAVPASASRSHRGDNDLQWPSRSEVDGSRGHEFSLSEKRSSADNGRFQGSSATIAQGQAHSQRVNKPAKNHRATGNGNIGPNKAAQVPLPGTRSRDLVCSSCGQMRGSFIIAMGKPYHAHCFRCFTCREVIDPSTPFAVAENDHGQNRPHHRECYAEACSIRCTVCKERIPRDNNGTISFVKHPFFDREIMCPRHAESPGRRCSGCNRFEPEDEPFADLNDNERCLCYACCRSVVVDSGDADPVWAKVLDFFENTLKLPVWEEMRNIPVVIVQSREMDNEMKRCRSPHRGQKQIMARGCCLVNYDENPSHEHGRLMRAPSMRFESSSKSFRSIGDDREAFTYFDIPDGAQGNPHCHIHAILCLSGLPRDLVAGILAHEATHAWIQLHPKYDHEELMPHTIEEGCAQLVAMLLLSDGLDPPPTSESSASEGPSDEKLRQYFRFCIERDESELFGDGYRRAAAVYRDIGIETLLSHVVRYKDFPKT